MSFLVSGLMCLMVSLVGAEMRCPMFRTQDDSYPGQLADRYINQCPSSSGNPQDEYCCYDLQFTARCCNLNDFLVNVSILAVVLLILLMLLATVVSCVCCICCPCCFLYKRRHAGRVYRSEPGSTNIPTRTTSNPEYTPIHKTHLPPGAYPVLPPTAEIRNFHSHR